MSNAMAHQILRNLRNKLKRQQDAVTQTEAEIAMWEKQAQDAQTQIPQPKAGK